MDATCPCSPMGTVPADRCDLFTSSGNWSAQSVYPCQRNNLGKLLFALDEGQANDNQSETGMLNDYLAPWMGSQKPVRCHREGSLEKYNQSLCVKGQGSTLLGNDVYHNWPTRPLTGDGDNPSDRSH
ncbi:MAG TPA: hypothetical protein GXX21_03880 [Syntrophomonadaceae bacterium]|nr:hypothetical protein [Syntrophomonadaceae bacterium]